MKEIDKTYLANYGLVGIIGINRLINLYLTYKAIDLGKIEMNPLLKKILSNKPLTYFLNSLYVSALGVSNYVVKKKSEKNLENLSYVFIPQMLIDAWLIVHNYNEIMKIIKEKQEEEFRKQMAEEKGYRYRRGEKVYF